MKSNVCVQWSAEGIPTIQTRGWRTLTLLTPAICKSATSIADICDPAHSKTEPAFTSAPIRRTPWPGAAETLIVKGGPSALTQPKSTTQSHPSGITSPTETATGATIKKDGLKELAPIKSTLAAAKPSRAAESRAGRQEGAATSQEMEAPTLSLISTNNCAAGAQ